MCWICYEHGDEQDMVAPCKCKGSMGWVHPQCLLQWVTATEAEADARLRCPQCRAEYRFSSAASSCAGRAATPALAQLRRMHPWPRGRLLPSGAKLAELDPVLAEHTQWRLRACISALLPPLLGLGCALAVLLEFWRVRDAGGPGARIGFADPRMRPQLDTRLAAVWPAWYGRSPSASAKAARRAAHAAAAGSRAAGGSHGSVAQFLVSEVWSTHFVLLQRTNSLCVALAVLLRGCGWYDWVDWRPGGHFCTSSARRAVSRAARFVLCTHVPVARALRVGLTQYALPVLRPWARAHALLWRFCYAWFDSPAEVALTVAQLVLVLALWGRACLRERLRARASVEAFWELTWLGGLAQQQRQAEQERGQQGGGPAAGGHDGAGGAAAAGGGGDGGGGGGGDGDAGDAGGDDDNEGGGGGAGDGPAEAALADLEAAGDGPLVWLIRTGVTVFTTVGFLVACSYTFEYDQHDMSADEL
eukprot:g7645.t1